MIRLQLKTDILSAIDTALLATSDGAAAREAWATAIAEAVANAIEVAIEGTAVNTSQASAGGDPVVGTITLEPNIS